MKTADLHTHTTCSDGTYTPSELVVYAAKKGLSAIAVTDHDTAEGIEEAVYQGKKSGIEVIPGIEVSTEYGETDIHIVGLFVDINDSEFLNILSVLREKRKARNELMAEKLRELGIDISYEDIVKAAEGGVVTRAHVAKALAEKGCVGTIKEAFDRYIGKHKPAYVRREVPNWETTFEILRQNGALAILAHPFLYKLGKERLEAMVSELAEKGLTGIEAYYSTHSPSDTEYIKSIAHKNRLLLSGGSDFHGKNKPHIDLGTGTGSLAVPYELLERLKERKVYGQGQYKKHSSQ